MTRNKQKRNGDQPSPQKYSIQTQAIQIKSIVSQFHWYEMLVMVMVVLLLLFLLSPTLAFIARLLSAWNESRIAVNDAIFTTGNFKQILFRLVSATRQHRRRSQSSCWWWWASHEGDESNAETMNTCIRLIFWHLFAIEILSTINLIVLSCLVWQAFWL